MKIINCIVACLLFSVLIISCSNEAEVSQESTSLVSDISALKTQVPNPMHDSSQEGIYHGVVASGTTQSRGKIWVNVANYSNYNALIELVDGGVLEFHLDPESVVEAANMTIFVFESNQGHFTLDLNDPETPEISDIVLMNESYFGRVVKSMSNNMASSVTATFSETGNPGFSGTWNLIADGTVFDPNENGGDGITSLLITIDGNSEEDFDFDEFNTNDCLGISSYTPTLNSYGVADYVICDYQTSAFAGGTAKWYLSYEQPGGAYMNYFTCEPALAGTFTWTSDDGTVYKEGEIVLD